MSARGYRILLCTRLRHQPTGTVAWPANASEASWRRVGGRAVYSYREAACIEDAAEWIKYYTGHRGAYTPFTQRKAS